jgi:hypothetical protein
MELAEVKQLPELAKLPNIAKHCQNLDAADEAHSHSEVRVVFNFQSLAILAISICYSLQLCPH